MKMRITRILLQSDSLRSFISKRIIERFKSAEEIASYMGLTPSEYSTGQHVRQGRITRCGNSRARTCLVEGSWHLIVKDLFMRVKYMTLKNRKEAKRAIIAIARNLIARIKESF